MYVLLFYLYLPLNNDISRNLGIFPERVCASEKCVRMILLWKTHYWHVLDILCGNSITGWIQRLFFYFFYFLYEKNLHKTRNWATTESRKRQPHYRQSRWTKFRTTGGDTPLQTWLILLHFAKWATHAQPCWIQRLVLWWKILVNNHREPKLSMTREPSMRNNNKAKQNQTKPSNVGKTRVE